MPIPSSLTQNTRQLFACGLFALVLLSCSGPTPTPTFTPVATFTVAPMLTATNTSTPPPTATFTPIPPTPTATPYPPLAAQGPYLLYGWDVEGGQLTLLNADGSGRATATLEDHLPLLGLSTAISPDGQWLAYKVGAAETPNHLALRLQAILTPTTAFTLPLIAQDYPETLALVLEDLTDPTSEFVWDKEEFKTQVFEHCLGQVAWSPDGRWLAFVSQMDGPSADVYLYDAQTGATKRLTNDLALACAVTWSPDGQWLLYENIQQLGQNQNDMTLHRTQPNSNPTTNPQILEEGYWWQGLGWASPTHYLIGGFGDGGSDYDLRVLNVTTGKITDLWPKTYEAYAVDAANAQVAVSTLDEEEDDYGFFLVSLTGAATKISDEVYWTLDFRGGAKTRFIGNNSQQMVGIAADGGTTLVLGLPGDWESGTHVSVSPDARWLVLYNDHGRGLMLFSETDERVTTLPDFAPTDLTWRPDSLGLFFVTQDNALYYWPVPEAEPMLIDICTSECDFRASNWAWVP